MRMLKLPQPVQLCQDAKVLKTSFAEFQAGIDDDASPVDAGPPRSRQARYQVATDRRHQVRQGRQPFPGVGSAAQMGQNQPHVGLVDHPRQLGVESQGR